MKGVVDGFDRACLPPGLFFFPILSANSVCMQSKIHESKSELLGLLAGRRALGPPCTHSLPLTPRSLFHVVFTHTGGD
jgi:hypothetical protein